MGCVGIDNLSMGIDNLSMGIDNLSMGIDNLSTNNITYTSDILDNNIIQDRGKENCPPSASIDIDFEKIYQEIVIAYSSFWACVSDIRQISAFRSQQNFEMLNQNLKNAKYNPSQCVRLALKKIKTLIKNGKSSKPLFDFKDIFFSLLINGDYGIERVYSATELAEIERQKKQREKYTTEIKNAMSNILDDETLEYHTEISKYFDIDISKVRDFIDNYEGGFPAFQREFNFRKENYEGAVYVR